MQHGANLYADNIPLFRQRLSHKSVKAYATMPISIMGSKRLALLIEVQDDSATRNEKERIRVFVLFPSNTLKHLEVQIKQS